MKDHNIIRGGGKGEGRRKRNKNAGKNMQGSETFEYLQAKTVPLHYFHIENTLSMVLIWNDPNSPHD